MTNCVFLRSHIFLYLFLLDSCLLGENALPLFPEWTWLHAIHFSKDQRARNGRKTAVSFEKKELSSFSQLVLSWNAFRPEKGYLSFDVRVRDKKSGEWSNWRRMHEWGKNLQRSYYGASDGVAQVNHVRLELEKGRLADAFEIKVRAHKGASLAQLAHCYVSLSQMDLFASELGTSCSFASLLVEEVPHYSQFCLDHAENNRICSPTSCSMLVHFMTKSAVSAVDFAQGVYDEGLDTYGSWPYNIAHAFDQAKGKYRFYVTRLHSFAYLYEQLTKKVPVVVSVRGSLDGAPKPYLNGHLLVVVGFDQKTNSVICHDPAILSKESVLQNYPWESFVRAWERSHRLAYIVDTGV